MRLKLALVLLICINSVFVFSQEKYKNSALSAYERAVDLTSRLTVAEKATLMMDVSQPVERLGIKGFNWWNEALHGVARAGVATVFPQPIGMAATFEPELIQKSFTAVSDEARAKNTAFTNAGSIKRYQGLTMWTPTINIFRDPRWGRGIETYGEDPFLTSRMGVAVVNGLQSPDGSKYDKIHACAKHFAVHSGPEWNRHSFDAKDIDVRELHETYLPAFKALVQEAKVKEVMCAYNRFEGHPCCGSKQLLMDILRNNWGYDGLVVADCGAIADFYKTNAHATHPNAATASAAAVYSGTDIDCGSSYKALTEAVEKAYISEKDIDVSVVRLLKARFELGEMDDPTEVKWTKIPYSVVASDAHDSLSLEVAKKSLVLLQNKNNILPLAKSGLKIAVMGPNANDSIMQWGNYNGTPKRTITILDGIQQLVGNKNQLIYNKACELVDTTLFSSSFGNCTTGEVKGFSASYWNNAVFAGEPVVQNIVNNPFKFCTSGATVFAPGVQLQDFSAVYTSTFIPEKSGEAVLSFYYCGNVKVLVNNKEVKSFKSNHGGRKNDVTINVEKGKSYDIQINFSYTMGDAQLNFDLGFKQEFNIEKTVKSVSEADYVIFVGGISPSLEGEEMGVKLPGFKGGDRTNIELPSVQRNLVAALHNAGKKVIFVNCSGSPIGLEPEVENCDAIVQAWYPGQSGGKAVAQVLFGDYNPAGRLPVTFYKNINQLPDFENYSMKGRTYRYMTEKPLFPFGYGLSYSKFNYSKPKITDKKITESENSKCVVKVKNTSKVDGEEVVQLYIKKLDDCNGPVKTLRAFKRVKIPAGQTVKVEFELNSKTLEWWNSATNTITYTKGKYQISTGGNSVLNKSKCNLISLN